MVISSSTGDNLISFPTTCLHNSSRRSSQRVCLPDCLCLAHILNIRKIKQYFLFWYYCLFPVRHIVVVSKHARHLREIILVVPLQVLPGTWGAVLWGTEGRWGTYPSRTGYLQPNWKWSSCLPGPKPSTTFHNLGVCLVWWSPQSLSIFPCACLQKSATWDYTLSNYSAHTLYWYIAHHSEECLRLLLHVCK